MKCKECENRILKQPYDEVPDFSFEPYYYCRVTGMELDLEKNNRCTLLI